MLLTLSARTFARQMNLDPKATPGREGLHCLHDLPQFATKELDLRGLNIHASLLAGWAPADLDRLRDRADKAGCPCLVLIEDSPLPLADPDPKRRGGAADRIRRLATAAHRLGCSSICVACEGADSQDVFDQLLAEFKATMPSIERMEINVLLAPAPGLTKKAERLTDLIKKIGGFRIGSLPSFQHAAESGDMVGTLRRLAPYAGTIQASISQIAKDGTHPAYDLGACVEAIKSVGFVNTLAIEYLGKEDPRWTVQQARTLLSAIIGTDE